MSITPVLWKSKFDINAVSAGSQNNVNVIALSDGRFLNVWTDDSGIHGDSFGIFGQYFDASGQPDGSVFQVNGTVIAGNQNLVRVATNPGGQVVYIYETDGGTRLDFEMYDASGALISFGNLVTAPNGQEVDFADVAMQPDSSFMVSFRRAVDLGLHEDIEVVHVFGGVVSGPFIVHDDTATTSTDENGTKTRLIALSDGNYFVAHEIRSGADTAIQISLVKPDGTNSVVIVLDESSGLNSDTDVDMVELATGQIIVTWDSGNDILAVLLNPDGSQASDPIEVTGATANNDSEPVVTALHDGGFIVVWDNNTQGRIEGRRFDENGQDIGSAFTIVTETTDDVYQAEVTTLTDGRVVVSWTEADTVSSAIWDPRTTGSFTPDNFYIGLATSDTVTFDGTEAGAFLAGGDDVFNFTGFGGTSADNVIIDSGDGVDTVSFANLSLGVYMTGTFYDGTALLYELLPNGNFNNLLTRINAENLIGSSQRDIIHGSNYVQNTIYGGNGNDSIIAAVDAAPPLYSTVSGNAFYGEGGDDTLGFDAYTVFGATAGGRASFDNIFDGGTGTDTLSFRTLNEDTVVTLNEGATAGSWINYWSSAVYGTLYGIENVLAGDGHDEINGSSLDNIILGNGGEDVIRGGDGNDQLFGGDGYDELFGEDGNDLIHGDGGDDYILGGNGNDQIFGGEGTDIVNGGEGNDYISGNSDDDFLSGNDGDDIILGHDGNDDIRGGLGVDELDGGDGDDFIIGEEGDDIVRGGNGTDLILGDEGDDAIDGGAGFDTVDYENSNSGVIVNLDDAVRAGQAVRTASDGYGGTDTLRFIEFVTGSEHDDIIYGSATRNTLEGGDGDDELFGRAGNDTLIGGMGQNILNGASGFDTVVYGPDAGSMSVRLDIGTATEVPAAGSSITDTLVSIEIVRFENAVFNSFLGNDANNRLFGGDGQENADGGGGNDIMYGEGGDDNLQGGLGSDRLYGGEGDDSLRGQDGIDIMDGGEGNDDMYGGADGDRMYGRTGNDLMFGDEGIDMLFGQEGNDILRGGADRDFLYGGDGDDDLWGEQGDDRIEGGDGIDTAYFAGNSSDYSYFRSSSGAIVIEHTGGNMSDGRDIITNVEFLTFDGDSVTIDVATIM